MCDCIDLVNHKLKDRNTRLTVESAVNLETGTLRNTLTVATEKLLSGRGKATTVFVSFCPFCGEKCVPDTKAA